MGQAVLKFVHRGDSDGKKRRETSSADAPVILKAQVAPVTPIVPIDAIAQPRSIPSIQHLNAFLTLAKVGSFAAASHQLGLGRLTLSKHVFTVETALGASLVERPSGTLTAEGRIAARALRPHMTRLATAAKGPKSQDPVLTIALPTGRLGTLLAPILRGFEQVHLGPISIVPGYANAAMCFRNRPRRATAEDIFLYADEWAAVAGAGWQGGTDLLTSELAQLPLVAATLEEVDAWHHLLYGQMPRELIRTTQVKADEMVADGRALGIANVPLLRALDGASGASPLTIVYRHHASPGTGMWATLRTDTPAWDLGWRFAYACKCIFAEDPAQASPPVD